MGVKFLNVFCTQILFYQVAYMNAIQPKPGGPKALRQRRKRLRRVLRQNCAPWNLVLLEKQRKLVVLTFEFLSHDIAVCLAHAWLVSIVTTWLTSCFDKYRGNTDMIFYFTKWKRRLMI
jgi:hypothetical protein